MGYTTKFTGQFSLDEKLTLAQAALLDKIESEYDDSIYAPAALEIAGLKATNPPDGYFQWKPTADRNGIQWNGGEKFYDYEHWLQWLIDNFLTPWKIGISGEVKFQGEDRKDFGALKVEDGKVIKVDAPVASWGKCDKKARKRVVEGIAAAAEYGDYFRKEDWPVFQAAIALLNADQ